MSPHHLERHRSHRGAWLRAAVLGANDGIVSTASLVLGVAASQASPAALLVAGVAGLVGGSLSMAVGELVSVGSQRDIEEADLARERRELATAPEHELEELTGLYVDRGVPRDLALQVAAALTAANPLAAHAREELNIDVGALTRPWQAAFSSGLSFALGSAVPLGVMVLGPASSRGVATFAAASVGLGVLGAWSARIGGAPVLPAMGRVLLGGWGAMGLTMAIGALFGRTA